MELIPLYTLLAPLALLPVEIIFPYPFIAEELTKAIFVFLALKSSPIKKTYFTVFTLAGFLFALSETVLYSINANYFGQINYFLVRFVLTSVLHTTTFLIIAGVSWRSKKLIPLGLAINILIHYLYNLYIPSILTLVK
jgi:hypothetical protein